MPANTQPIFPLTPKVQWGVLFTANTMRDGTGTNNIATVFTAGENGSRIDLIKVRTLINNPQNVLRFYINNGKPNSDWGNNSLVHEVSLPAITSSDNTATADTIVTVNVGSEVRPPIIYLPANYKILCSLGTNSTSSIQITVFGGDY
jgi:hypothetical protein